MTGDINMFLTLIMQSTFSSNHVVVLIDRSTTLLICGVGTIWLKMCIHILEIKNVLYVPRLDDTLFSITEHIKYKNCSFIGDDNKYTLKFPTFLFLQWSLMKYSFHMNTHPITIKWCHFWQKLHMMYLTTMINMQII